MISNSGMRPSTWQTKLQDITETLQFELLLLCFKSSITQFSTSNSALYTAKMGAPPPPPPPSTNVSKSSTPAPGPIVQPPSVGSIRPAGALLLELIIYNGKPFKDHWAYFVRSSVLPEVGVLIHATDDVRAGFELEIRRNYDFRMTNNQPSKRVPLQWIEAKFVDERAMCNNGTYKFDKNPVCLFEQSALKVKAPEKSLNSANNAVSLA